MRLSPSEIAILRINTSAFKVHIPYLRTIKFNCCVLRENAIINCCCGIADHHTADALHTTLRSSLGAATNQAAIENQRSSVTNTIIARNRAAIQNQCTVISNARTSIIIMIIIILTNFSGLCIGHVCNRQLRTGCNPKDGIFYRIANGFENLKTVEVQGQIRRGDLHGAVYRHILQKGQGAAFAGIGCTHRFQESRVGCYRFSCGHAGFVPFRRCHAGQQHKYHKQHRQ